MTTIKSALARASPLPCITPVRTSTPLKSSLSTIQPILPDILSSTNIEKSRTKKRVRFALKLEPVEEDSSPSSDHDNSISLSTKSKKQVIDPWRENGPLYGTYVEYLDSKDTSTPEIPELNLPSPLIESSTYTHTFVIQSKSPEIVIDSITVTTPSRHLPPLVQRTKPTKTINKKPLTPIFDPYLKQRSNAPTPPRQIQSRKIPANVKYQSNSIQSTVKRTDLALPSIKTLNSNDKPNGTDQTFGTKIVNEYIQTKKLTEIITNPLPGTNNQINTLTGHSILPNLKKNSIHNESYFFQNHTNDRLQPIIH